MLKKDQRSEDRKANYRLKGQFTRNVTYSPLPPSLSKLLYLLAEHLNGQCDCMLAWPSQGYLARKLGLSRRRVEQLIRQVKQIGCFDVQPMTQVELVRYCKEHYGFAIRLAGIDYRLNAYIPRHEHWLWQRQGTPEQYAELLESLQEYRNTRDNRNLKRFGLPQAENTETEIGVDTGTEIGVDTETGFGQEREKDTGGKPPVSQKCKPLSLSGDAANPSGPDSAGFAKGKGFTLEGSAGMWDEAWWEEVDEAETILPAASLLEVLEDPTEEAEEALTLLEGSAPLSPAAEQFPATDQSRIRQRLAGLAGSRYPVSATEGVSEATEAAQAAPVPPEPPKRKERPEKPQEAGAVVQLLQRSSKTAGLPTPPNVERYDNGWLHLARLYQEKLQSLLPSPLLEDDLVAGLQILAAENLRQPLNWLMLLMSKPLTRHLASLVWERVSARPKVYSPAERFDHLAVTPFFLLPPPRSTGSALLDGVGRLTQERHPEVLTPEVGVLGDLDGWWVDLRKLQPEALAALRSDWLATAPPCESPQDLTDTITLYCPLVEIEELEEEGEADEIHRQARAFLTT